MSIPAVVNIIPLISVHNNKNCYPQQRLPSKLFGETLVRKPTGFTSINKKTVPFASPKNEVEEDDKEQEGKQSVSLSLEDVNPVGLGRKSRQVFDEVWRKFSELGQLSRTPRTDEEYESVLVGGPMCEFTIPGAQDTTVLLVGATSRIGRIVARKLMLRGYKVKDYNHRLAQLRAGRSSKSKLTIAKFNRPEALEGWGVEQGTYSIDTFASKYDGGMDATFEFKETGNAVFSGFVFTRTGYVEITKKISLPLGFTLDRYEGLLFSVGGDGKAYTVILETGPAGDMSQSKLYFTRFATRIGFGRYRLPFSAFRPVKPNDPGLDPFLVHTMRIRFEPRKQRATTTTTKQGPRDSNNFKMILEYIKALPSGQETDFVLVSCTGAGIEPTIREKVIKAKQAGEHALRISGLGYTIIRPGPLQEEPGGQRALVFDQGNRISQGISCADVADICVKALHDSTARNKSFDVCYEYVAEQGQGLYELVAHLPDKSNNYLTPALAVLEKNT
ncbi:protein HIGH CHLOROPHYLL FLUORESCENCE PHENOTYPE 173, chloroplastic isoform X2 [Cryptomeria japonica]|uniref:protein HIGH CHLOROPHYLL FLUORESCENCE PHENOTYPE 173, chloroplastic isoform X2 n=1 Tax=Cryptomeria japonica TaxID=3369 RepID=UPI0027DA0056|nr:protein HIGH CHLOROPHYLL FLUORESCENCE PHENOTYPE 173, chloroplastic isoform X2 [Cryptomeria japonica]